MNPLTPMVRSLSLASLLIAGMTTAYAGVAESTLPFKSWPGDKPSVVVLRTAEKSCELGLSPTTHAQFFWKDATTPGQPVDAMKALGMAVLEKNGYDTGPGSTSGGFFPVYPAGFIVKEIALGSPGDVRKRIPISDRPAEFQQAQIDAFPAVATKALLLMTNYTHNRVGHSAYVLAAAFSDISDDDLRLLAFEEGVTRQFCWRSSD